jgi:hypothetical protein
LAQRLRQARVRWVSPGFVTGLDESIGFPAAAQVRDTDGHALVIGQSGRGAAAAARTAVTPTAP